MSEPLVGSSDDDLGASVMVVTLCAAIIALSFFLLRLYTTIQRDKSFGWDDATLLVAHIIFIIQTASVERAVANGLGERIEDVDSSSLSLFYKWTYTGDILAIFVQFLAKISVLLLVRRIDGEALKRKPVIGLAAAIVFWAIFSSFIISFQCDLPRPWEFVNGRCAADGRLLYVVIVLNIITDAGLAFFFLPVIWKLQMDKNTRIVVAVLFASRFIVCAVSIGRAAVLDRFLTSADKTWTITPYTILGQIVFSLSLIAAAIPCVHRYLAGLHTGMTALTISPHEMELTSSTNASKGRSYGNSKTVRSNKLSFISNDHQLSQPTSEKGLKLRPEMCADQKAYVSAVSDFGPGSQPKDGGVPRRSSGTDEDDVQPEDHSTSSLKKNVVYQKREFLMEVEYENGHDPEQIQSSLPTSRGNIV